jgi:hypothetical protein
VKNNVLKEEGIEIRIEEVNGLKTINIIQCDDCNIKYNGNIILQNTREECSAIPIQIRNQVKKCASTIEIDKDETIFDIDTRHGNYYCRVKTIIVDENKENLNMNNWLVSPEKIDECFDIDVDKYNKQIEVLKQTANELGFSFCESGEGSDFDVLYTLEVPIKNFDMNRVKEFLGVWEKYNIELEKLINKLNS